MRLKQNYAIKSTNCELESQFNGIRSTNYAIDGLTEKTLNCPSDEISKMMRK